MRKNNPGAPPPGTYCRDKKKHAKSWELMLALYKPYFTDEKLEEMNHRFETQANESLNTAIMMLAPKHKTLSTTMSLTNRVMIVACVKNYGFRRFWTEVFQDLGIEITPSMLLFLE